MSRLLQFPRESSAPAPTAKNDTRRRRCTTFIIPLQVVSTVQPTGEGLPMLVRSTDWAPVDLANRWAIYARRLDVAESTLRADLGALRFLYAWADRRFPEGPDARFAAGPLAYDDLLSLKDYLRAPDPLEPGRSALAARHTNDGDLVVDTAATGARALSALLFLKWALSPARRNERGAEPVNAAEGELQLQGVLGPLASLAGKGRERDVAPDDVVDAVEARLRPRQGTDGRFVMPLVWSPDNPFGPKTRLRNWLMWCLARDCGLRISEILTLYTTDMRVVGGEHFVVVVRRPDDALDTRLHRPQVKTMERALPLSAHAYFALTAYLRSTAAGARPRGGRFLISTVHGTALTLDSAEDVTQRLAAATNTPVGWHDLRHVWATTYARHVLSDALRGRGDRADDEVAMKALLVAELRTLGGWSDTSAEPWRYARTAIREHAMRNLRRVQEARLRPPPTRAAKAGPEAGNASLEQDDLWPC